MRVKPLSVSEITVHVDQGAFLSTLARDVHRGLTSRPKYVPSKYFYDARGSALFDHGIADVRAQGVGPVIISADPDDSPKRMYAALGFRPLVIEREYSIDLPESSKELG